MAVLERLEAVANLHDILGRHFTAEIEAGPLRLAPSEVKHVAELVVTQFQMSDTETDGLHILADLLRDDRIGDAIVDQPLKARDARKALGSILATAEGKYASFRNRPNSQIAEPETRASKLHSFCSNASSTMNIKYNPWIN